MSKLARADLALLAGFRRLDSLAYATNLRAVEGACVMTGRALAVGAGFSVLLLGLGGCATTPAEPAAQARAPLCAMERRVSFCDSSLSTALSLGTDRKVYRVVYIGDGGPYDAMVVRIAPDGSASLSYDRRGPAVLSPEELTEFESNLARASFEDQPVFGRPNGCLHGADYVIERLEGTSYKAVSRDECALQEDGLRPAVETLWAASKRLGLL